MSLLEVLPPFTLVSSAGGQVEKPPPGQPASTAHIPPARTATTVRYDQTPNTPPRPTGQVGQVAGTGRIRFGVITIMIPSLGPPKPAVPALCVPRRQTYGLFQCVHSTKPSKAGNLIILIRVFIANRCTRPFQCLTDSDSNFLKEMPNAPYHPVAVSTKLHGVQTAQEF